ncbi:hypothetical protein NC653_034874 [Populus alba x Populus x berolinensis]|uniref:Uncharacterized protein n=1 Tax=Populus alba x Populus x berolinensis TaxID=444605 RepID=A0AAD6PWJ5_9ROSI|nr:hypothetical protein NC653_034874 [Populus alba x Populus x berolinensis]
MPVKLIFDGNNKKELVTNGFCFSFVFDFKRTWIWKRILLSSLVYALKKVFNELESSSFGAALKLCYPSSFPENQNEKFSIAAHHCDFPVL